MVPTCWCCGKGGGVASLHSSPTSICMWPSVWDGQSMWSPGAAPSSLLTSKARDHFSSSFPSPSLSGHKLLPLFSLLWTWLAFPTGPFLRSLGSEGGVVWDWRAHVPCIHTQPAFGFRCCTGIPVQPSSQPAGWGREEDHSWIASSSRVKFRVLPQVREKLTSQEVWLFQGSRASWVLTHFQAPEKELSIHRLIERLQGSLSWPKHLADMRMFSKNESRRRNMQVSVNYEMTWHLSFLRL